MNDPFGRGLIAGVAGVIAINIAEFIMDLFGISETTLWEAGSIFFLTERAVETPLGIAIGVITHVFVSLVVGLLISYYLFFSGTDYAIFKGIVVSLLGLFITLGIVFPMRELVPEIHDSPNDVLSAYIDHIIFGALAGHIIKYFTNKEKKEQS